MKTVFTLVLLAGCIVGGVYVFRLGTAPPVASEASDFRATRVGGEEFQFSEIKGKPALLLFCSTDIGADACDSALPFVRELHTRYGQRGFRVVLVMVSEYALAQIPPGMEDWARGHLVRDVDPFVVRHFLARRDIPFPVILGDREIAQQFGANGVPYLAFVDRKGRVALKGGGLSPDGSCPFMQVKGYELERRIKSALGPACLYLNVGCRQ